MNKYQCTDVNGRAFHIMSADALPTDARGNVSQTWIQAQNSNRAQHGRAAIVSCVLVETTR